MDIPPPPRDVPGKSDGQPMTGPYDDRDLPKQGIPTAYRCHVCGGTKSVRRSVLMCRICDAPPLKEN